VNKKLVVSIIVPIYNVENYLERCINSILNQTYSNLEIILIDDGSKDNGSKICDSFAKKDNRIIAVHKENGGLSDARNYGLKMATGKYICFVDGDDWIEKDMIEVFLFQLIKNNADICIGRRFRSNSFNEKKIEKFRTYPKNKILDKEQGLKYLMSFTGYDMSVCDKMFKKELWSKIEFPYGKTCEDSFTTYKVFANSNKSVYLHQGMYNYFYRENSISRNSKVNETVIEANEEQLDFIRSKLPNLIVEATSSYLTSIISVENEYLNRNVSWKEHEKYVAIAKKNLKIALKNNNISNIKKMQFIIFCFSKRIYKIIYLLLKK